MQKRSRGRGHLVRKSKSLLSSRSQQLDVSVDWHLKAAPLSGEWTRWPPSTPVTSCENSMGVFVALLVFSAWKPQRQLWRTEDQWYEAWMSFLLCVFNSSPPPPRHFADDIFICIFVNDKFWVFIKNNWSLFPRVQLTITQHWFR